MTADLIVDFTKQIIFGEPEAETDFDRIVLFLR